jgi:hypothetical protein
MEDSASPELGRSQGLTDLVRSLGQLPDPLLTELEETAGSAQSMRRGPGTSAPVVISRSTTLWALLQVDISLRVDLRRAGLELTDLSRELGIPPHSSALPEATVVSVAANLARAVANHLASAPTEHRTDHLDVAEAILLSCRDIEVGTLPKRLRRLGVDVEAAIASVQALRRPASFSSSVRRVSEHLATSPVTASRMAQELQKDHEEYAGATFGAVVIDPETGSRQPAESWLVRVAELYDADEVGASSHEVIDGRLLLLGLAELDSHLVAALRRDGVLGRLRAEAEVHPRRVRPDQTEWAPDEPAAEDSEDYLGRRFLADVLARRLARLDQEGSMPFLVHLDGPWGSGKTTVFRFLERRLADRFLVVRVNAWREQRVGVQWWTLHQALRRALRERARIPVVADLTGFWDVARTRAPQVLGVLGALVLVSGLLLVVDLPGAGVFADLAVKLVTLGALVVAGLTALRTFLLPHSRRSAKTYVDSSPNPIADVSDLFRRSLRRAPRPVVFLIDDLDRCDEDYVVGFLEVVQTLLRDASTDARTKPARATTRGPYGFVAADGQWLRSSYENKYASSRLTGVPGRPLGYLFLEKIFQLRVRLPTVTEQGRDAFYASLLRRSTVTSSESDEQAHRVDAARKAVAAARTGDALTRVTDQVSHITDPQQRMGILGAAAVRFAELTLDQETENELLPFGRLLEPNPRSMKLFVNHVNILRSLRLLEGVRVQTETLAVWTIIEIRWPLLADHLRAHPQHIGGREAGAPDEIAELLARDEVQDVLFRSEWGPLTVDQVRLCTGAVA